MVIVANSHWVSLRPEKTRATLSLLESPIPTGYLSDEKERRWKICNLKVANSHWVSLRPIADRMVTQVPVANSHWVSRRPNLFSTYCLYKSRAF